MSDPINFDTFDTSDINEQFISMEFCNTPISFDDVLQKYNELDSSQINFDYVLQEYNESDDNLFENTQINLNENELFIQKLFEIHSDKFDYSKVNYIDDSTNITLICKIHGYIKVMPHRAIKNDPCAKCNFFNSDTQFIEQNQKYFIKKAKKIYGDKYDYSEVDYKNYVTPVTIICKKHGRFSVIPYLFIDKRKLYECIDCIKSSLNRMTNREFIGKLIDRYGDEFDFSNVEFVHKDRFVNIICKIHGSVFSKACIVMHDIPCRMCRCIESDKIFFIKKELFKHHNLYDFSHINYVDDITPIKIKCKIHGELIVQPCEFKKMKGHHTLCVKNSD